ncbi:MAG: hypothetical protein AAF624_00225, partial [Bacteroidota bacterium]
MASPARPLCFHDPRPTTHDPRPTTHDPRPTTFQTSPGGARYLVWHLTSDPVPVPTPTHILVVADAPDLALLVRQKFR